MLTDRQKEIVKSTVPLLETGGEALTTHFYKTMLGEYPEVRPLFNQAHQQSGAQPRALANSVLMYAKHIDQLEQLGGLDAVINNAGVTADALLMRMTDEQYHKVISSNLDSCFFCTRAAINHMAREKRGKIVNITSVVGLTGNAGQANYAASKAGIVGLTKSTAKEVARWGVCVNAVAPGFIETAMTDQLGDLARDALKKSIPLRRIGKAEDVAHMVSFLCSEGADYVTGQVFLVDGGMAM